MIPIKLPKTPKIILVKITNPPNKSMCSLNVENLTKEMVDKTMLKVYLRVRNVRPMDKIPENRVINKPFKR